MENVPAAKMLVREMHNHHHHRQTHGQYAPADSSHTKKYGMSPPQPELTRQPKSQPAQYDKRGTHRNTPRQHFTYPIQKPTRTTYQKSSASTLMPPRRLAAVIVVGPILLRGPTPKRRCRRKRNQWNKPRKPLELTPPKAKNRPQNKPHDKDQKGTKNAKNLHLYNYDPLLCCRGNNRSTRRKSQTSYHIGGVWRNERRYIPLEIIPRQRMSLRT